MQDLIDYRLVRSFKCLSKLSSATVVCVGILVLLGWTFDIAVLKTIVPGFVTMKANTAVAFVLAGVSLWLLHSETADHWRRGSAIACAGASGLLGWLNLSEYLWGWDLGIDQLLFRDFQATPVPPGRMAVTTALSFLILGIAQLFLASNGRRNHYPVQLLCLAAALLCFLALLGYSYGVESLYDVGPFTAMALHTGLTFIFLSFGVLFARPDRGLMAIVTSNSAGGLVVRRLLAAIFGVPFVFGKLILLGHQAELYDTAIALALLVALSTLVLGLLFSLDAWSLHRADVRRLRAEEEHRLTLERLRVSEERFRAIVQTAQDAVVTIDERGVVLSWNEAAAATFGYSAGEMVGKPLSLIIPARHREGHEQGLTRMRATREPRLVGKTVELDGLRKDGSEFPLELSLGMWKTREEIIFSGIIRDISERKQHQQYLAYLATHDSLTGLPNRRVLEENMGRVVGRARRGVASCILFMDVDDFKTVNDRYGHAAGDQVLKTIAQLLKDQFRFEDLVARLGGDEFAVLLEGTDVSTAYSITERMRGAIDEFDFSVDNHQVSLSLSIGLAAVDGQYGPLEVLAQADTAMYAAKGQGGNRVVTYCRPTTEVRGTGVSGG